MKISCEIIKDLLPLYHDEVCSEDSKTLVMKHLAECDDCNSDLQAMDGVIAVGSKEQNLKEADAIKNLSMKWRKGMLKSFLKGALITVLVIAALALILYLFIDFRIVY